MKDGKGANDSHVIPGVTTVICLTVQGKLDKNLNQARMLLLDEYFNQLSLIKGTISGITPLELTRRDYIDNKLKVY